MASAHAADLSIAPASGSFAPKKPFTVDLVMNGNTSAINAISGEISFPTDLLSVSSISKAGSIIKLWPEEPHYSNAEGTVQFEGVILNPGFSGSSGVVLSVTFVPKKSGNADLTYTSGSVLANDGEGTNVIGSMGEAHFTIRLVDAIAQPSIEKPLAVKNSLNAPVITSVTHPDSNKWYSAPRASFSWDAPIGVTAVRLLADDRPTATPVRVYSPAITGKDIDIDSDGIHYLHVQFKGAGGWGDVSHFRYQSDRTPPVFSSLAFSGGAVGASTTPTVVFSARDALSGVDVYGIRIDDGDFVPYQVSTATSSSYVVPKQKFGTHEVFVKAIDKAGNSFVSSAEFTVVGVDSPALTYVPKNMRAGDDLDVRGIGPANTSISLFLVNKGSVGSASTSTKSTTPEDSSDTVLAKKVRSDASGNFSAKIVSGISSGLYGVSAQAIDDRGVRSVVTEPIAIIVGGKPFNFTTFFGVPLLLVVLFFMYRFFFRRKSDSLKVSSQPLLRAKAAFKESFSDPERGVRENIRLLYKLGAARDLTKEERVILRLLEGRLDVLARKSVKIGRKK